MNTRNDIQNETDHQSAAEWFVALNAETMDQATNDAFIAWLNNSPENQADYERCEAAAIMVEKLKSDPDLAWAFEESAQLAAGSAPQLQRRSLTRWFNRRKLEFGMAGLTIVGVAVVLVQYGGDEITEAPTLSTGQMADTLAPEDAFADPIVVLPGAVVVPSNSVAVLPFQDLGSDPNSVNTTKNLHVEILSQLAAMPNLYVPVQASVMPYAAGGYSITEVASQLGVRGIVEGSVRQAGDQVRVTVQLIDASTGEHLFAGVYDRLVTDLSEIRADVVTNIAAALDSGARLTRSVLPHSIAVLPFENFSLDPDNAYYASRIHEEILNQLAKLSALNVIARTSVVEYADTDKSIPEIARELNVETVMEGSVRYVDGRILITVQLIDPETNAHLWSESYNRQFSDIFAIQADIAMRIANALEAEFSLEEQATIDAAPTESPEAYALYLRALDTFGTGDLRTVPSTLNRAIALDPGFANAYALMARYYAEQLLSGAAGNNPNEVERLALENADLALSLDPTVAFAHLALGQLHQLNGRAEDALAYYRRAVDLSPDLAEYIETKLGYAIAP